MEEEELMNIRNSISSSNPLKKYTEQYLTCREPFINLRPLGSEPQKLIDTRLQREPSGRQTGTPELGKTELRGGGGQSGFSRLQSEGRRHSCESQCVAERQEVTTDEKYLIN